MKIHKLLILVSLSLMLTSISTFSQTSKVQEEGYILLTDFVRANTSTENIYKIALAKKDNAYFFLIENEITMYDLKLIDTVGLSVTLQIYTVKKNAESTWMEEDKIDLTSPQETIESGKYQRIVAFHLADSIAHDLKNQLLGEITFANDLSSAEWGYNATKLSFRAVEPAKSYFVKYSSKITTSHGSFTDVKKFITDKIPFYSLMEKDNLFIDSKIGDPTSSKSSSKNITNTYETVHAFYTIQFIDGKSSKIELIPKYNFKYTARQFVYDRYPIEIDNCNCGEYTTRSGSGIITNTFSDKSKHYIHFKQGGRFLKEVSVERRL